MDSRIRSSSSKETTVLDIEGFCYVNGEVFSMILYADHSDKNRTEMEIVGGLEKFLMYLHSQDFHNDRGFGCEE